MSTKLGEFTMLKEVMSHQKLHLFIMIYLKIKILVV